MLTFILLNHYLEQNIYIQLQRTRSQGFFLFVFFLLRKNQVQLLITASQLDRISLQDGCGKRLIRTGDSIYLSMFYLLQLFISASHIVLTYTSLLKVRVSVLGSRCVPLCFCVHVCMRLFVNGCVYMYMCA